MQTYEKGHKQPSSHSCTELSKTKFSFVSLKTENLTNKYSEKRKISSKNLSKRFFRPGSSHCISALKRKLPGEIRSQNTYDEVPEVPKFPACNFTKNGLLPRYFSTILTATFRITII